MRSSLFARTLATLGALAVAIAAAHPAVAADPYEIQVYDGTAADPGEIGLEWHLNRVMNGAREATAPLEPSHHQTHGTFEPSYGVTPWWELGAYLQTVLTADGQLDWAGAKLRSKFVTPPSFHPNARLGVNFELARVPSRFDESPWSAEVRPIAAWESARWLFAVNPIVGVALSGAGRSDGPAFEPAAATKIKLGHLAVGLEYYGDLGPIAHPAPRSEQAHYVYETIDLIDVGRLEWNLGVGEGLGGAADGLVLKTILGWSWETRETEGAAR